MTTDKDEEFYRIQAKAIYERAQERYRDASKLQGEYGRWLVSTIAIVHLGATAIVVNASKELIADKAPTLTIIVAGLVLIFFCGFTTWINWGLNMNAHDRVGDIRILVSEKFLVKETPHGFWINLTFYLSIIFGFLSVAMMPLALWCALSPPACQ